MAHYPLEVLLADCESRPDEDLDLEGKLIGGKVQRTCLFDEVGSSCGAAYVKSAAPEDEPTALSNMSEAT